ncbi:hypothetical protein MMC08_001446 [Hypocenomyce scalaris]|nr:hypothetical protein [Hypocenomyce scalaris]
MSELDAQRIRNLLRNTQAARGAPQRPARFTSDQFGLQDPPPERLQFIRPGLSSNLFIANPDPPVRNTQAARGAPQRSARFTSDQFGLQDPPPERLQSIRPGSSSNLFIANPDPSESDTSATNNLTTLTSSVYQPPSATLQATTYEDSSSILQPTVYQAPPRSEAGPLRVINQDQPTPPPVKERQLSLYNPAADRVPRSYSQPYAENLNKDGKCTTAPWKSPNFPDLTCGYRIVRPLAFFDQEEEASIKRLATSKEQEETDKEQEEPKEQEETSTAQEETAKEHKDTSIAQERTAEGQEESSTAQEETVKGQAETPKPDV